MIHVRVGVGMGEGVGVLRGTVRVSHRIMFKSRGR